MRRCILALVVASSLCSCISTATRDRIDTLNRDMAALNTQIQKTEPTNVALTDMRARLESMRKELDNAKTQALRERIASGADATKQVVDVASPILGSMFPPLLIALNMIGAAAVFLRDKFKKPEVVDGNSP